jgi:hypothetical protein
MSCWYRRRRVARSDDCCATSVSSNVGKLTIGTPVKERNSIIIGDSANDRIREVLNIMSYRSFASLSSDSTSMSQDRELLWDTIGQRIQSADIVCRYLNRAPDSSLAEKEIG